MVQWCTGQRTSSHRRVGERRKSVASGLGDMRSRIPECSFLDPHPTFHASRPTALFHQPLHAFRTYMQLRTLCCRNLFLNTHSDSERSLSYFWSHSVLSCGELQLLFPHCLASYWGMTHGMGRMEDQSPLSCDRSSCFFTHYMCWPFCLLVT